MKISNLICFSLFLTLASCFQNTGNKTSTAITVLTDNSDSMPVTPHGTSFSSIIGDDIYEGWLIRFVEVNNISLGRSEEFSLEASTRRQTPKKIRSSQHAKLKTAVATHCQELRSSRSNSDRSIIFEKLTSEIERLHRNPAQRKFLFLYSDCLEYDSLCFYDPATFSRLESEPDKVRKELLKLSETDYSDLTIFWVYQPSNYKENARYRVIRNFLNQSLAHYHITFIPCGKTPRSLAEYAQL